MDGSSSKERIARIALGLFARKGFESVGVKEIAEKSGLTKPSLYHHFGSKEGLLEAVLWEDGRKLLDLTEKAAEYRRDITGNLHRLFGETLDFSLEHRDFFRLALRLFASAPETPGYKTGAALRHKLTGIYRGLFAAATPDHGNMRGREAMYAETFWGLIAACAALGMNGDAAFDETTRRRIVHQYMHGIFS
ncbi:MAG: TetR/AcrR family transcriptional regulator [Spirochaetaceae bacterium]|jgi:TetR/AcrR family transcriptional regulator|nr:TetR/AcrR family transcriptional regulator [Spirochaetaceae bacterium]